MSDERIPEEIVKYEPKRGHRSIGRTRKRMERQERKRFGLIHGRRRSRRQIDTPLTAIILSVM
jgi:hypothetical protein